MTLMAQYAIIFILTCILILHVCIVIKIIPYNTIWGGRLQTDKQMVQFETISIIITLLLLFFMLLQIGIFQIVIPKIATITVFIIMSILFFFNSLGNIKSNNKLEKIVFTPITIILSLLCMLLAFIT